YVLDNYTSVFGTPYKIVRIVQPPDGNDRYPNQNGDYRTYSNAVFVNKTVLLPVYEEQYDTTALRIWRENLPGYRVVGINCNSIISASGAIHCITHSVGVNDPLLISHQALHDTYDTENNYQVSALIRHRSGISNAKLYWTTDTTQAYELVDMTVTDEANHIFTGFIPAQPAGTEVFYFIGATAESGKSQVRPIVAPDGSWSFMVLDSGLVTGLAKQVTENLFSLKAFPNPASGLVCVPLQSEIPLSVKLEVLDITGRVVEEVFEGRIQTGEKRFYLHTQNWQPGIYLIRATTHSGSVVQRITVQ
ncbi:MAG: agmatine deiminase family protein, partial [Bacteroidetes bacterium]|nr:agmatine deiminase family protein [Bacteroidota bacterium]